MCDTYKGGDEGLACLCTTPQDGMIVLAMPIGIFKCQLCFANAPQSINSLWLRQSGLLLALQPTCELRQQVLLSGEKRIARQGNIPKRRQGAEFGIVRIMQQRQGWVHGDRPLLDGDGMLFREPGQLITDKAPDLRNSQPSIFGWRLFKGAK